MAINSVTGMGNLGNDAEIRYFPNGDGAGVAAVSIAITERYKDKTGEQKERTTWVPIKIYGPSGRMQYCEKYLVKGQRVAFTGKLETEQWPDKDNPGGKPKTRLVVRVDELELAGTPRRAGDNAGGNAGGNAGAGNGQDSAGGDFDPSQWNNEDDNIPF